MTVSGVFFHPPKSHTTIQTYTLLNVSSRKVTKFEHPTRRPTGVIKYPLEDETAGETATEEDVHVEKTAGETAIEEDIFRDKRKSVQFDTINIDELTIEKAEEDTDDNEFEGSDGENEERRSSRV